MAVSLPGWRGMRGMTDTWGRTAVEDGVGGLRWESPFNSPDDAEPEHTPDPNDPATAGCLLALLGPAAAGLTAITPPYDGGPVRYIGAGIHSAIKLGRACIAAAEALGRWPGGAG